MAAENQTLLRQWAMLRAIPRYPLKITANELTQKLLAEQFSISKRTVERDLIQLSGIFPLINDSRNKPFGWSWQKDATSFNLPSLSNHEALILVMAEQHLTELLPNITNTVLAPHFKAAKQVLSTQHNAKYSKSWLNKVRSTSANQVLLSPVMDDVVQHVVTDALLSEKQLNISYQKHGDKAAQQYRVHPLALVRRGNLAYLIVTFFDYTDTRMLAMHRIQSAELLPDAIKIPADFDIDTEIAQGKLSFGDGNMIKLVAEFSVELGEYFYETPFSTDQTISENDAVLTVTATVADTPQLKWWLLSFGSGVKVLKPARLSKLLKVEIEQMQYIYQK